LWGWSAALGTLRQCLMTVPSGSTITVDLITPTVFFPYIIFSPLLFLEFFTRNLNLLIKPGILQILCLSYIKRWFFSLEKLPASNSGDSTSSSLSAIIHPKKMCMKVLKRMVLIKGGSRTQIFRYLVSFNNSVLYPGLDRVSWSGLITIHFVESLPESVIKLSEKANRTDCFNLDRER